MQKMQKKKVALVLSSGGPRGFAYIGAIEELEARGYEITSIAGTSIGSLVGGIYAAGRLDEFKEWLFTLSNWKMFKLVDFSFSRNHLVKGEKIISAIKGIVPDIKIEELPIHFCAIATDLYTGQEVVFDKGHLFEAIRSSISIPSLFRPMEYGKMLLVDGAVSNCLPLNRVKRTEGDILVAFSVYDIDIEETEQAMEMKIINELEYERLKARKIDEIEQTMDHISNSDIPFTRKVSMIWSRARSAAQSIRTYRKTNLKESLTIGDNLYEVMNRSTSIMNYHASRMALRLTPPDVLATMSFDEHSDMSDYANAKATAERGRQLMAEALDRYEAQLH